MSPRRPDLPPLRRRELAVDPIEQFAAWFERARAEAPLAEAMTLATVDSDGMPDARMVLLKGFGAEGFRFFTNYGSVKARQLEASGDAALVIYWRELDRQVRIRGEVERLPGPDSDAYFATRPRDAQLGAWASPQSEPLGSREELDRRLDELDERFAGGEVPRPPGWGGYLLRPATIEFWQGEAHRLHDRFRYTREDDGWRIGRLAP
jgi:pyridoxamine 5'-phosphate oxidase